MANNTTRFPLQTSNNASEAAHGSFVLYVANISVLIPMALLSPVAVVANALVLTVICRNVSLRTTSHILLAGLAFTDFCTGLISQPFFVANGLIYLDYPHSHRSDEETTPSKMHWIPTDITYGCLAYFYQLTVLIITLMSIERWLIMSRRSLLTVRRVSLIVAVLSLLVIPSAIWIGQVSVSGQASHLAVSSLTLFCAIVTSVAYFKVFRIIRRHQQQIQASISSQNAAQPAINIAKYKKSVLTILYILAVFYIGYLPMIITVCLWLTILKTFELITFLFNLSTLLVFLSSSLNPLIVLCRMKDIRDEVIKLLKRLSCKSNLQVQ